MLKKVIFGSVAAIVLSVGALATECTPIDIQLTQVSGGKKLVLDRKLYVCSSPTVGRNVVKTSYMTKNTNDVLGELKSTSLISGTFEVGLTYSISKHDEERFNFEYTLSKLDSLVTGPDGVQLPEISESYQSLVLNLDTPTKIELELGEVNYFWTLNLS